MVGRNQALQLQTILTVEPVNERLFTLGGQVSAFTPSKDSALKELVAELRHCPAWAMSRRSSLTTRLRELLKCPDLIVHNDLRFDTQDETTAGFLNGLGSEVNFTSQPSAYGFTLLGELGEVLWRDRRHELLSSVPEGVKKKHIRLGSDTLELIWADPAMLSELEFQELSHRFRQLSCLMTCGEPRCTLAWLEVGSLTWDYVRGGSAGQGLDELPRLLREFRGRGMKLDCKLTEWPVQLPAKQSQTAFGVIQEGLRNAFKHATGSKVRLTVKRADGHLYITVRDWGAGMRNRPKSKGKSLGLRQLRWRVRTCGGESRLCELAGRGCALQVRLPVP